MTQNKTLSISLISKDLQISKSNFIFFDFLGTVFKGPQIGFEGEKDYNPFYMLIQVLDRFPILVLNENFCWVEYQIGADSMSQGIWKQYKRSPRSYARYRINEMVMHHGNGWGNKMRLCVHYVSSCILSRDKDWLNKSPLKLMTLLLSPLGGMLALVVMWKNRK